MKFRNICTIILTCIGYSAVSHAEICSVVNVNADTQMYDQYLIMTMVPSNAEPSQTWASGTRIVLKCDTSGVVEVALACTGNYSADGTLPLSGVRGRCATQLADGIKMFFYALQTKASIAVTLANVDTAATNMSFGKFGAPTKVIRQYAIEAPK